MARPHVLPQTRKPPRGATAIISMESTIPRRIAVIGAGLTGLLIGQGLRKRGINVTIYDKEAHLGERLREWTVMVHWAMSALKNVLPEDIFKDLHRAYTDPFYPYDNERESIPIYHAVKGHVAIRANAVGARRFSRVRLREVLTKGLDIQWGKEFKDIHAPESGPVTIEFQDGSSATADLVIGCDGSRSKVRRWLFGGEEADPRPSDWVMCSGIVNYHDAELTRRLRAPHPIFTMAYMYDGLAFLAVQDVLDPKDPETWSFHIARFWKQQMGGSKFGGEALEELKARTSSDVVCEPFLSSVENIPASETGFTINQLHYWISTPWDNRNGRVTLAGDAAHSMLPSRGQGLNNALQCVNNLLNGFEKLEEGISMTDMLQTYEVEAVERGSQAVVESLEDASDLTKLEELEKSRMYQKGLSK